MTASFVVTAGITTLSLLVLAAWVWFVYRAATPANRPTLTARFGLFVGAWAALTFGLAASGVIAQNTRPPPLVFVFAAMIIGVILLLRSRYGALLATTPLWMLVGLQAFRLPLELVMHQAASEGTMPRQMTFGEGGLNYDIVTGITALLLALAMRRRKVPLGLVLAWNLLGSLLLGIIVTVSILSTPLFARFGTARLNTWVMYAPYIWLPAVLVASAFFGHALILNAIARETAAAAPKKR